tara:strand:- start:998 stop:1156 length:159 start_codon:yes stop_codon:yes gene_type:complete
MNKTQIIETTIAVAAVIGLVVVLPLTGAMAAGLLIAGALATMAALEAKTRSY